MFGKHRKHTNYCFKQAVALGFVTLLYMLSLNLYLTTSSNNLNSNRACSCKIENSFNSDQDIFQDKKSFTSTSEEDSTRDDDQQNWGLNVTGSWEDRGFMFNPYNFSYLIEPVKLCKKHTKLLIYIHSTPAKQDRRNLIRQTWANKKFHFLHKRAALVFVVGRSDIDDDESINDDLEAENADHNDILQLDYTESYYRITYKALSTLKWILTNCANTTQYILKTDDDIILNTLLVEKTLAKKFSFGMVNHTEAIMHCSSLNHRTQFMSTTRWKVTRDEYPFSSHPPYCFGAGFIFNRKALEEMYKASYHVHFLKLDDVFISGVLAEAAGVKRTNGIFRYMNHYKAPKLLESSGKFLINRTLLVHTYKTKTFNQVWEAISSWMKAQK